jgi:hypothetical protein
MGLGLCPRETPNRSAVATGSPGSHFRRDRLGPDPARRFAGAGGSSACTWGYLWRSTRRSAGRPAEAGAQHPIFGT